MIAIIEARVVFVVLVEWIVLVECGVIDLALANGFFM